MTFRKFVAATTRECLRMMREALGADAMIVSTRRTAQGVEVVGIKSTDVQRDAPVAAEPSPPPSPGASGAPGWDAEDEQPVSLSPAAKVLARQYASDDATGLPRVNWPRVPEKDIPHLVRPVRPSVPAAETPRARQPAPEPAQPRGAAARAPLDPGTGRASVQEKEARRALATELSAPIVDEMRSMRDWLGHQMGAMTWRDATQRAPIRRSAWRRMVDAGFTPELARTVGLKLPDVADEEQAAHWLAEVLTRNLPVVDPVQGMIERGGRFALVGPTGVGKTTTAAKIAAHCAVKYGASSLGLISTDLHRMGAVDQLRTFGRMLGVEVYAARGATDLEVILDSMADRHLVLIDTAGLSQRDDTLPQHLQAMEVGGVERVLVMPAATQAEQAGEVMRAYGEARLAGMIVTKLDEAVRIGGVLDVAIRSRAPLHLVTNGQRVPEDMHAANASMLVHRALRARPSPVFALDAEELDWSCMPMTRTG